jgi:hypothetical protein
MNKEFQVHPLNEQGKNKASRIAELFDGLLNDLYHFGLEGRELAIVKTKLEEACFFAKKGIAVQLENQLKE